METAKNMKKKDKIIFNLRSTPDENLTEKEVKSIIKKYDFFCKCYINTISYI